MAQRNRRLKFDNPELDGSIRLLSSRVDSQTFADGRRTLTVNLARVMNFKDHFYGKVELTRKKFMTMIKNFDENVYGQDVFIDVAHNPSDGAAATINKLFMDGKKFRAEVEFTDFGVDAVNKRGFRYLSIDFTENYTDPETEKEYGPLLFGAGLTIRPRVKKLDPVQFSFDKDTQPFIANNQISMLLSEEIKTMWEKIWKKLQEQLLSLKLSEGALSQYAVQFEDVAKKLGDDEDALQQVSNSFLATAKTLAESGATTENIKLDFSGLDVKAGLSTADLNKLLDEREEKAAKAKIKLDEQRGTNVAHFMKLLDEAEGLASLPEDQRTMLSDAAELITPEMATDQVTRLAEQQIKLGNQMVVSTQLSGMGFQGGRQGSVSITLDESNSIKSLQESIIKGLKGTSQHSTGALILGEKTNPFVDKVLAEFDVIQAERLHAEHKLFAGESTGIADTNFPAGFQRTVIREALSDLNVLQLINTLTDPSAQSTTEIPYETRDVSALNNDGVVFEGQGIHRASIIQAMDTAYILPRKIAFLISNEVMHFSRASNIDWDAYARNVASNARYMRELIHRALCNEMQRSADSYLAADVANEGFDAQLDGATVSTVKTVNFPIVRAYQPRDLKGNNVGTAENTIVVRLNGAAISEFDGSGSQAAATYYRITNYNLGYVQFVDETGAAVTPPNAAGADDISYSYATNMVKFDTDNGGTELGLHLNGLLRAIGGRKAVMSSDRFVTPDFALMSSTVNDTCSNANQFEEANQKEGANLDSMGDLARVKGVNAWKSDAPSVDLGDERILMGQRGTTSYTIAKPFVTGQPFEAVDANGKATGQKQAYGEEYSAIKTPAPIRNRFTSVIVYSAAGR